MSDDPSRDQDPASAPEPEVVPPTSGMDETQPYASLYNQDAAPPPYGAPQSPPAQALPPQAPHPYAPPPTTPQHYAQPWYGQPGQPQYAPQGYVQPYYTAPMPMQYAMPARYGIDPASGMPWSDKSRTTAGLLSLLLPLIGVCGVGRLYAGNVALGLFQLLGFWFGAFTILFIVGIFIAPAIWLWAVIDGIILLAAGGKDAYGRPLRS
jgi:TM2 domain-containing membrane protein YozV